MSLLFSDALATTAQAAAGAGEASPSPIPSFLMIAVLLGVFYLLMWRPQQKRMKEHKSLMESLAKGDEVVTNGGLLGRIANVDEQFIVLTIADGVNVRIQKNAIAQSMPKGTLDHKVTQ